MGEVAATENAQARVAQVFGEVTAAETERLQITSLFVEVWMVPAETAGGGNDPIQGGSIQGLPYLGRSFVQGASTLKRRR